MLPLLFALEMASAEVPLPNARQLDFMELELTQVSVRACRDALFFVVM